MRVYKVYNTLHKKVYSSEPEALEGHHSPKQKPGSSGQGPV